MKPANELRRVADRLADNLPLFGAEITTNKAAALLDECEQLVADLIQWDNREGRDPWEPLIKNARATLAKLRGGA